MNTNKKILDACCGSRMMWFDKSNDLVEFGDIRKETLIVTDRSNNKPDGKRVVEINPDVMFDFRELPYDDESFYLIAFDPPHLVQAGKSSWLAAKYGKLGTNWQDDLKKGFNECFRVLKPNGVLIFKWNETQIKLKDVIVCSPHAPLFGNVAGKKNGTYWMTFIKPEIS